MDAETPLPPVDVVDPDGDLAPWQVDISAEHGYVTLNRTAAAPLRFALGGLAGAHRLIFAATAAQLAGALAGATVRTDCRTNATSLYLPISRYISLLVYLAMCAYISIYLHISPYISQVRIDYLTNASVHLAVTDAEGARGAAEDYGDIVEI